MMLLNWYHGKILYLCNALTKKRDSAQSADVSEANVYILIYSITIFHNKLTNIV